MDIVMMKITMRTANLMVVTVVHLNSILQNSIHIVLYVNVLEVKVEQHQNLTHPMEEVI